MGLWKMLRHCVKGQCPPHRRLAAGVAGLTWLMCGVSEAALALGNTGRRRERKDCSRVSLYCCKSLICRPNETWELPRIPGGPCPLRAFTLSEQSIYLVSGNLTTNQILPEVYIEYKVPFIFGLYMTYDLLLSFKRCTFGIAHSYSFFQFLIS